MHIRHVDHRDTAFTLIFGTCAEWIKQRRMMQKSANTSHHDDSSTYDGMVTRPVNV